MTETDLSPVLRECDREKDGARVCSASRFFKQWLDNHEERWREMAQSGALERAYEAGGHNDELEQVVACDSQKQAEARLRRTRNERMALITWRDLTGAADLAETFAALSDLADGCIETALTCISKHRDEKQEGMPELIIIGMGKLGGRELNFSSDIDLIFSYTPPDDDEFDVRPLKRRARELVRFLNEPTEHGFVFRVDVRLRPFGDSGPLVSSVGAMESYYQSHGREWERYAWVKARPVAGDIKGGDALIKGLQPFVYRRYLDYNAFESIRDMKSMIEKQVARRGTEANIKTGRGGIREIEFIAQAFQLIRGGHEPALRSRRLLPTLSQLAEAGHLPPYVAEELREAYVFLRRVENRIQMWADRQTHDLPDDPAPRAAMAQAMDFVDWDSFHAELEAHRRRVHGQFQQVFAAPQVEDETDDQTQALEDAWNGEDDAEQAEQLLAEQGFNEPEEAWAALSELRSGSLYQSLGERGRRRLAELIPILIRVLASSENPDANLHRLLRVLSRIVGRSTYVALLVENPTALSRLVKLCGASPWITRQIEQQPLLLDSLLDPRVLYRPPRQAEMEKLLKAAMDTLPEDGLERRMDMLRQFRQQQMLRVAAADVSNAIPLMVVSDHLTELAETIVNSALELAWQQMTSRYGQPLLENGERAPFAVIGYGKMGGLELGYSSDLDVVFIYDGPDNAETDGERALSHSVFFMRLAQRLIHLLATQTGAGRAYEVDTRLRPSGRSGLLVTSLSAFKNYQEKNAWTWEHQALVRARPVAGDVKLAEDFRDVRADVLAQRREESDLRDDVVKMRDKMRVNLERPEAGRFDVKQAPGGLIDIEFLAQYCVLRFACDCPPLLDFTDTIRVLETMESGELLDYETTQSLTNAYRAYRRRTHAAALQEERTRADDDEFQDERKAVSAAWKKFLEQDS